MQNNYLSVLNKNVGLKVWGGGEGGGTNIPLPPNKKSEGGGGHMPLHPPLPTPVISI